MIRSSTRRLPPSPVRIQGCLAWPLPPMPCGSEAIRTRRSCEAARLLQLAQDLAHPFSLALAHCYAAMLHQFRREPRLVQQQAEAAMTPLY